MKSIKCRISEVSLKSEDILYVDIAEQEKFSAKDFRELKLAANRLGEGRKFYNLINIGEYTTPDKEARKLSSSIIGSIYKKADAYIIQSETQQKVGSQMLKIDEPSVPTQFFTSVKDAENWIQSLKKNEITILG